MQKFARASHYIGGNPAIFFENGNHKGCWLGGLCKWNGGKTDIGYSASYRYENRYYPTQAKPARTSADTQYFPPYGSYDGMGTDFDESGMMGDGGWHCWEFYLKRNTAVGAADGVHKFWQDGQLIYEAYDIAFADVGAVSGPRKGWNYVTLGGNNFNLHAHVSTKSEQWYAIDDFVISTEYIGPDNCTPKGFHIK